MISKRNFLINILCLTLLATSACTKKSSNDETPSNPSDPGLGFDPLKETVTECGVVNNGKLSNPTRYKDGIAVTITDVLSNNLVEVREVDNFENDSVYLVKILGLGETNSEIRSDAAQDKINELTSRGAFLYKASKDCETFIPGQGRGVIGSIITSGGLSVAEQLISNDLSPVDQTDPCSGNLVRSCYNALQEDKKPLTYGEMEEGFLWKPASDKDGNLVIHAPPCDVDIIVNGATLQDAGAGNGRCSTARASRPGCAFGRATVRVIDRRSGLPYTFNGKPELIIPNGCNRVEIN